MNNREREGGRSCLTERSLKATKDFVRTDGGSVLIECGRTRVICTVSIEAHVPSWVKGTGAGWLTAEYGMLPGCSAVRINREKHLNSGRTKEIQRLIGRVLRAVVDFKTLGEKTIIVDCDVIEADGGTRTASVNGAMIALADAVLKMMDRGEISESPLLGFAAAVSVGIVGGEILVDLDYSEDSCADVDMNVAMTSGGKFIEIQGTAEHAPFGEDQLLDIVFAAKSSLSRTVEFQKSLFTQSQLESLKFFSA